MLLSAKLNQARLDGEPHKPSGCAFTAAGVNMRDEFAERQVSLPAITFHGLKYKAENRATDMGYFTHSGF
ncbi:MAG TPA: hypothetical protein VIK35_05240 [Verrucomicrobiae bacterium]